MQPDTKREAVRFGTDGIRGVAGAYPLDPQTCLVIGRAIGRWVVSSGANLSVVIGRDTRISGGMIGNAITAGLLAEGVNVTDLSVMTTPGVAYLTLARKAAAGIVVSASHNPFEQNGIKLFGADGYKLSDDAEAAIEHLITEIDLASPVPALGLWRTDLAAANDYVLWLTKPYPRRTLSRISLVLDCANGAASELAPAVFRELGARVHSLKASPNGVNINVSSGSEFVRRDRAPLLSAMRAENADLGLAFDGDADRVVAVTPDGMLLDGDHILGILATWWKEEDVLPPENTIVATEMSNSGLADYLAAHNLKLERTKVGDRYVMERMRAGGFTLGGEQAGHIIMLDDQKRTAGDGIYVGLLLAFIATQTIIDKTPDLSALAREIPRYPQVIASAHLAGKVPLETVAGLSERTAAALASFAGKGRVNLRFSGTEPNLLRAMVEGGPASTLNEVIRHALDFCGLVAIATKSDNPRIDVVDCMSGALVQR